MSNPKRYLVNSKINIHHVFLDREKKIISFSSDYDFEDKLEKIDFYSAPDVIWEYFDGSDNRHEWRRFFCWEFKESKIIKKHFSVPGECGADYVFSFDAVEDVLPDKNDDLAFERDIPFGRFNNMTEDQIREWKKKGLKGN